MLDKNSIRNSYLVYGLTDDQLDNVAAIASQRDLPAGEVLCRQGDPGGELFIIMSGELEVTTRDGEHLADVGPDAVVGEMGLIEARPRSATITAKTDAQVAVISSTVLREEMVADGHLGFLVLCNITRVLSDRLRHADAKLDALVIKTA